MKILYFAWLRERLNRGADEVSPPAEVASVADLIDWLATTNRPANATTTLIIPGGTNEFEFFRARSLEQP